MRHSTVLAELEVFHTRPAVPTRRIALGHLILPTDPSPGLGGLLLGAVVAQHIPGVDSELHGDIGNLIREVDDDRRIVQPRLRHRFQVDRHGLAVSRHSLFGINDEITFDFDTTGSDLAQVLAAVYAMERIEPVARHAISPLLHKAMRWRGPIGPGLIAYLAGSASTALTVLADPRAWALDLFGFDAGTSPSEQEIKQAYRSRLRAAHPDHGGERDEAGQAIQDLNEARRILADRG